MSCFEIFIKQMGNKVENAVIFSRVQYLYPQCFRPSFLISHPSVAITPLISLMKSCFFHCHFWRASAVINQRFGAVFCVAEFYGYNCLFGSTPVPLSTYHKPPSIQSHWNKIGLHLNFALVLFRFAGHLQSNFSLVFPLSWLPYSFVSFLAAQNTGFRILQWTVFSSILSFLYKVEFVSQLNCIRVNWSSWLVLVSLILSEVRLFKWSTTLS